MLQSFQRSWVVRVYGQYLPGLLSPSYCPWLARLTVCLFFNLLLSGDPWIWIRFEMETFVYFITQLIPFQSHTLTTCATLKLTLFRVNYRDPNNFSCILETVATSQNLKQSPASGTFFHFINWCSWLRRDQGSGC